METRANYVLIGAFTLAAVVGAFLFVMWIAGYATPGGHRNLPGRFQRLGLRPFERRQRPLQRHQGRRGHPSHLLEERSAHGRRRHRRQFGRADRPEHQGAARDAGAHRGWGGRPARRVDARAGAGRREWPACGHLRRTVDAAAGHSRQRRRPFHQGDLGSGRRREDHHRQFRADPFGDRECRCVLQGAGRQRARRRRGAEERGRTRQADRAARRAPADPVR